MGADICRDRAQARPPGEPNSEILCGRREQFYEPVSAVIKHAAKRGWCSHIVMERPEKPPSRVRWLTPEQAERRIAACGDHLRPLVIFLLYSGARIGEALWLDWRDIDLNRSHAAFPIDPSEGRRTKNNEPRGVPLHLRVRAELANLPHRDGAVFRRPDGLPYERLRDDENDTSAGNRIKRAFAAACRRAGIEDFTPHDCRHTWRRGTMPKTATCSRCNGSVAGRASRW